MCICGYFSIFECYLKITTIISASNASDVPHHALDLTIDSRNDCSSHYCLGFNSLLANSISPKGLSFSHYETKSAQEFALIHTEHKGMENRDNACRVALNQWEMSPYG